MTRKVMAVTGVTVLALLALTPALAAAQVPPATPVQVRQQQIAMMETVLRTAVQQGVNNLRTRVRAVMPADALLQAGPPEVRGFPIEGFGVFFDVEVPALQQSTAWMLEAMNQNNALLARELAQLRQSVASMSDPQAKSAAERALQNIQRQVGPVGPVAPILQGPAQIAAAPQGTVSAQSVPLVEATTPAQIDPLLISDPDQAYTQEVKKALIDAMIIYGAPLNIGANEWLTVAARDNAPVNALVQSADDFHTIMFRLKGSDLLEFQQGRLTMDQVRARVSVQEF